MCSTVGVKGSAKLEFNVRGMEPYIGCSRIMTTTMTLRPLILSLLVLPSFLAFGQEDTLRVQTLTFDSITTRRGWFEFPDASNTYRKALVKYTLKCDAQTTADQFACGEWDYLTYNFIYHHTGVMDSTALVHPTFKVNVDAPDSAELTAIEDWESLRPANPECPASPAVRRGTVPRYRSFPCPD